MTPFCMRHPIYEGIHYIPSTVKEIYDVVMACYCLMDVNTDGTLAITGQYDQDINLTVNPGDLLLRDKDTNKLCAISGTAAKMLFNDIEEHITQYTYRACAGRGRFQFVTLADPYESQLNPYYVDETAERVMAVRYDEHSSALFGYSDKRGNFRLDEVCLRCTKEALTFITSPSHIVRDGDWIILHDAGENGGSKVVGCQMLHDDAFRAQHSRV